MLLIPHIAPCLRTNEKCFVSSNASKITRESPDTKFVLILHMLALKVIQKDNET